MMDRKKAAEILRAIKAGTAHAFLNDDAITCALDTAINSLEQKEDLKWTRTADGLPDPWTFVWVTDRRGRLAVCQLFHKTGDWYDEEDEWLYYHDSIVAWMPYEVPEPYKVEESDG